MSMVLGAAVPADSPMMVKSPRMILILFAVAATMGVGDATSTAVPAFRLNTVGFLSEEPKQATLVGDARRFMLVRLSDGAEVFSGAVGGAITNADTGERLFTADFSAFTNAGTFQL